MLVLGRVGVMGGGIRLVVAVVEGRNGVQVNEAVIIVSNPQ